MVLIGEMWQVDNARWQLISVWASIWLRMGKNSRAIVTKFCQEGDGGWRTLFENIIWVWLRFGEAKSHMRLRGRYHTTTKNSYNTSWASVESSTDRSTVLIVSIIVAHGRYRCNSYKTRVVVYTTAVDATVIADIWGGGSNHAINDVAPPVEELVDLRA